MAYQSSTAHRPIVLPIGMTRLCITASWLARCPMSPAMTCLSNMSDTTLTSRRVVVSEDRGLGVTSHGVFTVIDTQPKWLLQGTVCVNNSASALHSFRAGQSGSRQWNCLRNPRVSSVATTARLRSENKWVLLLFHAVTAGLIRTTDATLCGSRLF